MHDGGLDAAAVPITVPQLLYKYSELACVWMVERDLISIAGGHQSTPRRSLFSEQVLRPVQDQGRAAMKTNIKSGKIDTCFEEVE